MKKTLTILAVLLCFTCIFAKSSINVNVIPYGFDFVSYEVGETKKTAKSSLLCGGEVAMQTEIGKGFFVEAGLGSTVTKLTGVESEDATLFEKPFANIYYFGGAGYKIDLGKVVTLSCHLDAGGDQRFIDEAMTYAFCLKTGTAISFKLNNVLSLKAGIDGQFAWNRKPINDDSILYSSIRVLPLMVMTVSL